MTAVASTCAAVVVLLASSVLMFANNNARLRANRDSADFLAAVDQQRLPLTVVGERGRVPAGSLESARNFLKEHGARDLDRFASSRRYRLIDQSLQAQERQAIAGLCFWIAHAYLRESQGERDPSKRSLKLEQAERANQLARQFVDTSKPLLMQCATIARAAGNPILADQWFQKANRLPKADSEFPLQLAANLMLDDRGTEATELLVQHIGSDPDDYSAWLVLGNVHSQNEEHRDAESCYSICIALDPATGRGHLYRGIARMEQGKLSEAFADLCEAHQLGADRFSVYFNRAIVLKKMEKWKQAVENLDRAIEVKPHCVRAFYTRALVHARMNQLDKSRQDIDTCLELKPTNELGWIARGLAHVQKRKYEQALEDFEIALELNPQSVTALQNCAAIHAEFLDNPNSAIRALSTLDQIRQDAKTIATRGVIHARSGNRTLAIADAKLALKLKPDSDIHYRVAGLFAQFSESRPSDGDQAVSHLANAIWTQIADTVRRIERDRDLQALDGHSDYERIREGLSFLQRLAVRPNDDDPLGDKQDQQK